MPLVGPRRRTLSVELVLNLAMVMGLLVLAQVEQSVQLRSTHPMHGVLDRVNENAGPYIGLVMAYPTEELALQTSGFFVPSSEIPWVDLAGKSQRLTLSVSISLSRSWFPFAQLSCFFSR